MPKLTDTQLVILSAAAAREEGSLLPLPASLKLKGSAVDTVLKSLIKRGLVQERPANRDEPAWRESDNEGRFTLMLTLEGYTTIGLKPEDSNDCQHQNIGSHPAAIDPLPSISDGSTCDASPVSDDGLTQVRSGTKQAALIDLLQRSEGATISDIQTATGWQAHSVRGAISGTLKKKLGLTVSSETDETRGRVYRIVKAQGRA